MVIAKTASRNVAFKAGKMSEAVFDTQANFVTPGIRGHDGSSQGMSRSMTMTLNVTQTY